MCFSVTTPLYVPLTQVGVYCPDSWNSGDRIPGTTLLRKAPVGIYSKCPMARCPKWLEKEDERKEVGNRYGAKTSLPHLRGVLHRM